MKTPRKSIPPTFAVTAADLLSGAAVPVRLQMNVTIRPGSREEAVPTGNARRNIAWRASLQAHETKLLEWAKQNPQNARLLAIDPRAAALQARLKMSPADQNLLAQGAGALDAGTTLPPGVELAGLEVTISNQPYQVTAAKGRRSNASQASASASRKPARNPKRGGRQ